MRNNREAVRQFILESFLFTDDQSALDDNDSFTEKAIIDSLGALEIATFLEEKFEITVSEDEMLPENLDSVERIVRLLDRKMTASA